jgi:hypothetical protein
MGTSKRALFLLITAMLLAPVFPAYGQTSGPLPAAPISPAPSEENITVAPPPLPRSCIIGGTPADYSLAVCCVSGYVYLNGAPVSGATVTISANGESISVPTQTGPGSSLPYFSASLDIAPLLVQPGDTVTLQAEVDGQQKSKSFVAQAGGQQVDVVLPQSSVDAEWVRVDIPGRDVSAVTYDNARQRIIQFGGTVSGVGTVNETLEWNGTNWYQRTPVNSPSARYGHALAYDAARQRIVLFGGEDNQGVLNDTWEWDGDNWTKLSPPLSPSARASFGMTYDSFHQRIVLFGGFDRQNIRLNDTWEWDGNTWTQRQPSSSPSAQAGLKMVYDSNRKRIVLVGSPSGQGVLPETWEWDGNNWQRIFTLTSLPTYAGGIAFDTNRNRIVWFGWKDANYRYIYEYDGINWVSKGFVLTDSANGAGVFPVTYDGLSNRTIFLSGVAGSTYSWDGTNWQKLAGQVNSPPRRINAGIAYEPNGMSLLYGGYDGITTLNDSYRWSGINWSPLTPAHKPAPRQNFGMASDENGTVLLFGGLDSNNSFLGDTWKWDGADWANLNPSSSPSARSFPAMTYDSLHHVWVIFGGFDNDLLNDTWEFDGNQWSHCQPAVNPPARMGATLTYDENLGVSYLISGQGPGFLYQDVWEWDGVNWKNVTPIGTQLPPRLDHSAAYDSTRKVIVIHGGTGDTILNDVWEWNGTFWRPRTLNWNAPVAIGFVMTYDRQNDRLIRFGGQNNSGLIRGTYLHQVLGSPLDAPPVATITRIQPRDARQGVDTIHLQGDGADADSSDVISAYRWTFGQQVLSTSASFDLPAANLPLGEQVVSLEVQDNEGNWSPAVSNHLYIRSGQDVSLGGKTWTLLIYADADNNLDPWMGDWSSTNGMLYRLKNAAAAANVKVGILYDGPGANDTHRYVLSSAGDWSKTDLPEAQMDQMETLSDFLLWGKQSLPSDYLAVSLANHANGIVGFGEDRTSSSDGSAFLTPIELRSALQAVTDDGAHKLDLLQFDGCSFGLFEDAAIAAGQAHFVIASPNTGWGVFAYDRYRQLANASLEPRQLATGIAQAYATAVAANGLPYTISVFDMANFDAIQTAIGSLGTSLLNYIQVDPPTRIAALKSLRNNLQKYDSGGSHPLETDNDDDYVDLADLAQTLKASISDTSVVSAANALLQALSGDHPFIAYEHHASGQFLYYDPAQGKDRSFSVSLDRAHGLGIYYPPRLTTSASSAYIRYTQDRLFDITHGWGWTSFIAQGLPPQGGFDPPPLPSSSLISPLTYEAKTTTYSLFVPSVKK